MLFLVGALAGLSREAGISATREAPSYSNASIVNSASNEPGALAPNAFVTIYGTNLARSTRAIADSDIVGNMLPTVLPGTGVNVYVNRIRAHIFYVSPGQINALIPADALAGSAEILVALDGVYGPSARVTLQASAPALFQLDAQTAIAVHADGTVLTPKTPGRPGEWIALYATGLGTTAPPAAYGEIPARAAPLRDSARFRVLLNSAAVEAERVPYAGVSPGFAGLYQVNVRLPDSLTRDPEIRLQAGDAFSKAGVVIPVEP